MNERTDEKNELTHFKSYKYYIAIILNVYEVEKHTK